MRGVEVYKRQPKSIRELKERREKSQFSDQEREELIVASMDLVRKILSGLKIPRHIYFDLLSEGYVGLIDAVDTYDPEFNVEFRHYAKYRVINAVFKAMEYQYSSIVRIPANLQELIRKLRPIWLPSDSQFSLEYCIPVETAKRMRQALHPAKEIKKDAIDHEILDMIHNAISSLGEHHQKIVKMKLGFDCKEHTFDEIAKTLSIHRETASRRFSAALEILRKKL